MKFVTVIIFLLTSSILQAADTTAVPKVDKTTEKVTVTIEGMHCSGCKKMVTVSVCEDKKIAELKSSCDVTVNDKTKVGTLILKSKESIRFDIAALESAILTADKEYSISRIDISRSNPTVK